MRKGTTIREALGRAAAAAAAAALLCVPAAGDPGRPGGVFDFGASARPLGMGGAYTAAARDATALYYNPAGLSMMPGRNLTLMRASLYEDIVYDYAAYGQNFSGKPGAWGVQVLRLGAGQAEGRNEAGDVTESFTYSETGLGFGAGLRGVFLPFLSLGASGKVLSRKLAGSSDSLLGVDLGAQYGPLYGGRLTLALALQNLGGFSSGDTSDKLPMLVKLGGAFKVSDDLSLTADLEQFDALRFGGEYLIGPAAVRLGYDRGAFSYGAGIKFLKSYHLDFAMMKHEVLGMSTRISLAAYFGTLASAPPKIQDRAGEYLERAEKRLKQKSYVEALDSVDSAVGMNLDIARGPWGDKQRRLRQITDGLMLRTSVDRQEQLKANTDQAKEANNAMQEYVAGNGLKSFLLAHSAAGYNPNSAFYSEVLRVIAKLNNREVVQDEILPRPTLVNSKVDKASAAFYAQNFDKVIKECQEALLLDEKNPEIWKKLGSAYFASGNTAGAKQAYERVLELSPDDQSVLRFMSVQGWR